MSVAEKKPSLIQNWISVAGLIVATGSLFAMLCLMAMDFFSASKNPYIGIVTYFVAPAFLGLGLFVIVGGMLFERHQLIRSQQGVVSWFPVVDLNRPRHRQILGSLIGFGVVLLLVIAVSRELPFHRVKTILRANLPHSDEAGIHRLPKLAARPCHLHRMSYWCRRDLVCALETFWQLSGVRHAFP